VSLYCRQVSAGAGMAAAAPMSGADCRLGHRTLERVPIKWNHLIDKDSLKIKVLEHVLIEKVEQLFRDML
jgi:hypothetical protein